MYNEQITSAWAALQCVPSTIATLWLARVTISSSAMFFCALAGSAHVTGGVHVTAYVRNLVAHRYLALLVGLCAVCILRENVI